jgi:TctA family transporter
MRFTFDFLELADGIGFVTVAMGMFGWAKSFAIWKTKMIDR